jgi:hypothetical protein
LNFSPFLIFMFFQTADEKLDSKIGGERVILLEDWKE